MPSGTGRQHLDRLQQEAKILLLFFLKNEGCSFLLTLSCKIELKLRQNLLPPKELYLLWDVCGVRWDDEAQTRKSKKLLKEINKMSLLLGDNVMSLMEANQRHHYEDTEAFYQNVITKRQTLDVLPFYPSNRGAVHEYARAVKLGTGEWRAANEGYSKSTSKLETFTENVHIFSSMSEVPEDVVMLEGEIARTSEDDMIARGLLEQFLDTFINGTGEDPKEMKGLAGLRPTLGSYCVSAGGTSNLTSLYLCEFGRDTLNIRYNPNMAGGEYGIGLKSKDRGLCQSYDRDNKVTYVWRTTYDLTAAVQLAKEEALVRIANLDITGDFPQDLLVDAMNLLPSGGTGAVILAPRPVYAMYMKYALNKENVAFSCEQIEGLGRIVRFLGVPIIREDAISTSETQITA